MTADDNDNRVITIPLPFSVKKGGNGGQGWGRLENTAEKVVRA